MKNKIIYFTLISISLLIFSCETDTKLGYNILPEGDILNFQIMDTSSVEVYTYLDDTIATDKTNTFLLGEYNDPIFGNSKASFVCEFVKAENAKYNNNTVIDSAILSLIPDTININNYGDKLNYQTIIVYELTDTLNKITHYANAPHQQYMTGNIIGQKLFIPKTGSGNIENTEISDTEINIKFENKYAEKFIQLIDTSLNIKDIFKGVYIMSKYEGDKGVIYRYKINSDFLIKIYSHNSETEKSNVFKISAFWSKVVKFNLFEHDYSSTMFYNNIGDETIEQDSVAYIQAMGGLKTKIKFPTIKKLKNLGEIAINRAELIVNTTSSSYSLEEDFLANEAMVLVGITNNSQYYYLPEYTTVNNHPKGVGYKDGSYKFDIAGYIRDILDGNIENNGLYLYAGANNTSMRRTVITTGNHSNKMKLIISYTKL